MAVRRRRRADRRVVIAIIIAGLALGGRASPVSACTSEDTPRPLADLVDEARLVVLAHQVTEADDGSLTIDWDRVLRAQDAPKPLKIPPAQSDCPYEWGLPSADHEALMLIADGPGGLTVTDLWIADQHGRLLTPIHHDEVAHPPRTMTALIRLILGHAPDTSTIAPGPRRTVDGRGAMAILIGMLAGGWVVLRGADRRTPRRRVGSRRA